MNSLLDYCKENSRKVAALVIVLLITAIVGTVLVKNGYAPGSVIALLIIELLLAALLHGMELWLHAALILVEILVGVILGKIFLVILCVVVYLALTVAQQIPGVRRN